MRFGVVGGRTRLLAACQNGCVYVFETGCGPLDSASKELPCHRLQPVADDIHTDPQRPVCSPDHSLHPNHLIIIQLSIRHMCCPHSGMCSLSGFLCEVLFWRSSTSNSECRVGVCTALSGSLYKVLVSAVGIPAFACDGVFQ